MLLNNFTIKKNVLAEPSKLTYETPQGPRKTQFEYQWSTLKSLSCEQTQYTPL